MSGLVAQINREYRIALDVLRQGSLLIDSNSMIQQSERGKSILSWSSIASLSYLYSTYSNIDHYRSVLRQRDFSLCFSDGGVIQMMYVVEDEAITGHRLCYFPCPFTFSDEEISAASLSDLPDFFSDGELRERIRMVSPLRFDYNQDFADDLHAHSHFSMNKDTCRLPAYGPMSMGHFLRFVLRYFYDFELEPATEWEDIKPILYKRTLSRPPTHELYLETAIQFS